MYRYIINELIVWKKKPTRAPLIIKGARQIGKTHILKEFGQKEFPVYHYLNFEEDKELAKIFIKDLKPQRILSDLSFYLNRPVDPDHDLLIFDEIQSCENALTSLKYFAEELPQMKLCSAGSLLGINLGEGSFPVGKVEFLNMFPMSFFEFLNAVEGRRSLDIMNKLQKGDELPEVVHDHLWDQFKNYLVVGGLPKGVQAFVDNQDDLFTAFQNVRAIQKNLALTYLADMAKHCGKLNAMHIERVWKNIPEQLARNQDGSAGKYKFKEVIPGIKGYLRLSGPLDWLEKAGLTIRVKITSQALLPFSAYTKENIFKLYLFDVGMLGALSDLPPKTILDYDYGTYKGFFAENFVAQEFKTAGVDSLYSWNEKTAEMEFLREVDGKIIPVEIKSGWRTQTKSLKVFLERYHPPYAAVMSAHPLKINPSSRIHRYPLYLASCFPRLSTAPGV